jgi:hypothetical protein
MRSRAAVTRPTRRSPADTTLATFRLLIDHVQGDPFAEASRLRALIPPDTALIPGWALHSATRRVATADFLNRTFHEALRTASAPRGSGNSGQLTVLQPGQQVLVLGSSSVHGGAGRQPSRRGSAPGCPRAGAPCMGRDAVRAASPSQVVARRHGHGLLPARPRHGRRCADTWRLWRTHAPCARSSVDHEPGRLRRQRRPPAATRSGIDDRPLAGDDVVPFRAPPSHDASRSMRSERRRHRPAWVSRRVSPSSWAAASTESPRSCAPSSAGSTTMSPGMGASASSHAEDSSEGPRRRRTRSVAGTDIGNFIGSNPGGGDTRFFVTTNASGSTSQAAAIIEAMEVGARMLCSSTRIRPPPTS